MYYVLYVFSLDAARARELLYREEKYNNNNDEKKKKQNKIPHR